MPQLTSADRTSIAYEQTGHGPAVVLVHVGPFTQASNAGLADLLAGRFTVYTYDRRGRGGSGGTVTDGPDREFEDLRAVIDQAGGHAHVYGSSGAGIIALQAASRGLPVSRLAVWEPPYAVAAPNPPADWGPQIASLVEAGRRGDAVAYWMTTILGMPEPFVAGMRDAPFWAGMEAEAHGLVADHALVGDLTFPPAAQLRAVEVPTLVLDGLDILQYGFGPVTRLLIEHCLLDELHIWLHPLLVGNTDPGDHIGVAGAESRWQLDDVRRYGSGLVILSYRLS